MCLPACLLTDSLSGCTLYGYLIMKIRPTMSVKSRWRWMQNKARGPGTPRYSQFPDVCKMDCTKIPRVWPILGLYAIAVRFTNLRKLPVLDIPVSPSLPHPLYRIPSIEKLHSLPVTITETANSHQEKKGKRIRDNGEATPFPISPGK